jgi:RNA polymerase sigma factor (sigma-70 family)
MDAEKILFEHYNYIQKIVQIKSNQYGLDYDDCLNFVLDKINQDDYKKIRAFKGESKFTTYITVVVNRLIISFARQKKKLPEIPEMIEQTPLDILIDKQKKEYQELFKKNLPELLNQLGVQERMVIKMKYFKDFNISQISQNLKITRYEIEKTLSSSLEFLKEKIKEICK